MIRAKFRVHNLEQFKDNQGAITAENVKMSPVYSDDPNSENRSFSNATPSGEISMWISNPAAFGKFERNKSYYVDFTEAPE